MSYLQTAMGLAEKLSNDMGKPFTEEKAEELIEDFYSAYPMLAKWQEKIQKVYSSQGHLKLPCGWYLWADNDNFRSVTNFSIQGLGGCILRKAVEFCDDAGLEVILTLHDAVYIEFDSNDFGAMDTLIDCMKRAFIFYFPEQEEDAAKIRVDPYVWSPDYSKDSEITTPKGEVIGASNIYIDERSVREYNQFSKYFLPREEDSL